MKIISEAIGLFLGLTLIVWGVAIWIDKPEQRSVTFCRPPHYLITAAGQLLSVARGGTSAEGTNYEWQDSARLSCLKTADRLFNNTK